MKRLWLAALLVAACVPARAEAPAQSTEARWDLRDLYPSVEAWSTEQVKIQAKVETLTSYRGTLGQSADAMLSALDAISVARKEIQRLYVYASLNKDEDVSNGKSQERELLAQSLASRLGEKTAWLAPEILKVGADKIRAFRQANRELDRRFGFFLDNTLRSAPHTLGDEAEGVMAAAGNVLAQPNNIYSQLTIGELPFPQVELSDGAMIKRLDKAAYAKYRASPNREDRKKVFDAFWSAWKGYEGSLGASLNTQVLAEEFVSRARKFPDALSAALFTDNMPEAVYRQLVAQANDGLPTFHRYLRLRKKLLGIDGDLAYYDMYPSMFKLASPPTFSLEKSKRIALIVTAPYGREYAAMLKRGFAGQWMDVYPRPKKQAGAYMNGAAYDVHPYLLLNHNDDYYSLSTLVHEWGHAVHTMLAAAAQPFETSEYSTFTAETASIANEMLLNDYMVAHAKTREEKLFYLGEGLESIRTTFFRQTMLGEFQLAIHEEVENGKALSGERLTQIYCGLLEHYYGADKGVTAIDPNYCVEWAYIPHFYYGFYVYQYATSMAGAASFAEAIERKEPGARERFIALLKAGGSDYPYDLYKRAGIDMASPAPYQALIARMNRIMDQIEELTK